MKKYEKVAEQLMKLMPKDVTLYTKRHKGLLLTISKEKKGLINLALDFKPIFVKDEEK